MTTAKSFNNNNNNAAAISVLETHADNNLFVHNGAAAKTYQYSDQYYTLSVNALIDACQLKRG